MKCTSCSSMVRPVVVSDIDGTLGDYHNTFKDFCVQYFQRYMPSYSWDGRGEFEDFLGLTKAEYREAKLAYRQGGNKRWMPMIPGAWQLCESVVHAGAELWLATTRPWMRLDNVDPDTRFWLGSHNIPFHGLLYGEDKYQQILEVVEKDRIVAALDDLPENCAIADSLDIPFILHDRPHNVRSHIEPRATLWEARDIIIDRIERWLDK